jgi:threonine dehydratase
MILHTKNNLLPVQGHDGVRDKIEQLQRTGSFKIRGATLRLESLGDAERRRGVVTASAGNHGLGVATAGKALGVRVEVVVPATSPEVKRRGIAALGATVVDGGAGYDEAEAFARRLAVERGAVFVSAFDDPWVQRGNGGTLAEEILADAPDVTQVVCPVGGGGLVAGLAEVLAPRGVAVFGVQPAANCAMHDSLAEGRARLVYDGRPTLAEGCEGAVAQSTFDACRRHGVRVGLVSEEAILRAMAFAFRRCGWIVEPSAAVAIAGLLEGALPPSPRTVIVVSGGNASPDLVDQALEAGSSKREA